MVIQDGFEIEDKVSGLRIKVHTGKNLDRLTIERFAEPLNPHRDFWFTKEGEFDGTGSNVQ